SCFVPRKGSKGEGDGYVMGIANNYETLSSDLVIVDAQRMSFAAPSRGRMPIMVGLLPSHSHIGSPVFRRASLVTRGMTGKMMYFCVIAMSCWMPT
ncbi:MAG: hypothetical protein EOP08_01535, partial [Proteobacteria bacterium]